MFQQYTINNSLPNYALLTANNTFTNFNTFSNNLLVNTYSNSYLTVGSGGGAYNTASLYLNPWNGRGQNCCSIYAIDNANYSGDLYFATAPTGYGNLGYGPINRMLINGDGVVTILGSFVSNNNNTISGYVTTTDFITNNIYNYNYFNTLSSNIYNINNTISGNTFYNYNYFNTLSSNIYNINNTISGNKFYNNNYFNTLSSNIYTINNSLVNYALLHSPNTYTSLNTYTNNILISTTINPTLTIAGGNSIINLNPWAGRGQNTVQIYASDNGYYSGDLYFATAPSGAGIYAPVNRMMISADGVVTILGSLVSNNSNTINGYVSNTDLTNALVSYTSNIALAAGLLIYLKTSDAITTYATITSLSSYVSTISSQIYTINNTLLNYSTLSSSLYSYAPLSILPNYTLSSSLYSYAPLSILPNYCLSSSLYSYAPLSILPNYCLSSYLYNYEKL
jgi:hypothetical protein